MEEHRFFKYIWRVNAIILLIAGLLVFGAFTVSGYMFYLEITRNRNTSNIVNIQEGAEVEEEWQLGHMSEIEGSPYVIISLNSDQNYAQSYYSKSTSSARNYL